MNKAFEKILEMLEELHERYINQYGIVGGNPMAFSVKECMLIVQEVAEEYHGDWIPCSERLPDDAFGCLVTIIDCEPSTQTDFENILPYVVGYDGDSWNDSDGNVIPFEVIAWQPLPKPFKERD